MVDYCEHTCVNCSNCEHDCSNNHTDEVSDAYRDGVIDGINQFKEALLSMLGDKTCGCAFDVHCVSHMLLQKWSSQ